MQRFLNTELFFSKTYTLKLVDSMIPIGSIVRVYVHDVNTPYTVVRRFEFYFPVTKNKILWTSAASE